MKRKSKSPAADSVTKVAEIKSLPGKPIQQAQRTLEILEKLLLHPTPKAIRDSELLLQDTCSLLGQCRKTLGDGSDPEDKAFKADLELFQRSCRRVENLLQGSLKIQWTRMRSIGSFTQTYTSTAKTKAWTPKSGTLNIQL